MKCEVDKVPRFRILTAIMSNVLKFYSNQSEFLTNQDTASEASQSLEISELETR